MDLATPPVAVRVVVRLMTFGRQISPGTRQLSLVTHLDRSKRAFRMRTMDVSEVEEALLTLGQVLERRGEEIALLVIGGSSLLLLGWTTRATTDVDVVAIVEPSGYRRATELPATISLAARDVGRALDLGDGWLNAGPAGLLDLGLPDGFASRVSIRRFGSLEVHLPGRRDLIAFKLFAAADLYPANRKHVQDLRAIAATQVELAAAAEWARTHDDSAAFGHLVEQATAQILGPDQ